MPRNITITLEDGTQHQYANVPDSVTPDQVISRATQDFGKGISAIDGGKSAQPEQHSTLANIGLGALKGATDIGTTLLKPVDYVLNKTGLTDMTNDQRKQALQQFYSEHANPESMAFKGGEIGSQIAGTAGVGGALGKGAMLGGKLIPNAAPYAEKLATALQTGGFKLGGAPATTGKEALVNALTRIGAGAAVGGASSGIINPDMAASGAAIGSAIPLLAKLGGATGSGVKAAIYDPIMNKNKLISSSLMRTIGQENAPDVISALGNKALTPGVNYSAGTASQNEALSAMEDALKTINPGGSLSTNAQTNRNVLANALRNIGQDESAITAAKNARSAATNDAYNAAKSQFVGIDADMAKLMGTPAAKQAWSRAERIASNNGEELALNGKLSINALHYMKMGIDDLIKDPTSGIGKAEKQSILGIKDKLINFMGNASPEYKQGIESYAEMSKPINQMQIGQKLADTFIPATAGDNPSAVNAASLARALRNEDALAQNATGFSGAKMSSIMTPEQLSTIGGVNTDASAIAEAARRGAGYGSATERRRATGSYIGQHFAERAPLLSKIFETVGNVPSINYATKGATALGGVMSKGINANIASQLDEMLAKNPEQVKSMLMQEMARLSPQEKAVVSKYLPESLFVSAPSVMNSFMNAQ
jgi:hypothetical protein